MAVVSISQTRLMAKRDINLKTDVARTIQEEPNADRLFEDLAADFAADVSSEPSDEERDTRSDEFLREEKARIHEHLELDRLAGDKPWIADPSIPDHVKHPAATFDEYGVHDSFYDFAKTYERLRRMVADEMRRAEPDRETYMMKAIAAVHEKTNAGNVEGFLDELCKRLANVKPPIARAERGQRLSVSRAEVESHLMTYLWTMLVAARAELKRLNSRIIQQTKKP